MKLIELVDFLKSQDHLVRLASSLDMDYASDDILVYMEGGLDLGADLSFFRLSETDDDLIFDQDGIHYVQFFPLKYMVSLAELDLGLLDKGFTNQKIAQRLLRYRIKDA